jgi:2-dehydropantoate 2-reductase
MKIAIIGTGGVGGYFGGRLANAGYDVSFLARGEHLNAIRSKGLQIKSIMGDFHLKPVKAFDKIKDMGISDLVILGVKAWQVKEVAGELNEIIHENSIVLPLQNGVLAIDDLKERIPPKNILGGICRIISKIESPGIIDHFAIEPAILFGELDNSKTDRVISVRDVFNNSGIYARIAEDIHAEIWKKFIAVCVSGLLAITRSTYGELRELKESRQLMIDFLTEIYILSQRIGIAIEHDFIDKTVSFIDTFPKNSTSSLARDVWEGKPSEIEYQNGTVVKLAEKYGIETPVNRFVYTCILPMEKKLRK